MPLTIPELGLLPVKHVTAQCRFRTVVIRTAVALFSHRCRIALLAFALLTFALLSLRTVDPFALLAFALLASHWCRSHFCLSHSCRTSPLENNDAEKTTDFIMRTRRRTRFFTRATSSEECWISVCVFSIRVCFCFCFFAFVLFFPSSSLPFLFPISLSVACRPTSFLLAHTHGILPDQPHTQSCTLLFFLLL